MRIVQNVSADVLAWLPNCTVIQCFDGNRFSVSDDSANIAMAYRNTNQFGIADSIESRYGVVDSADSDVDVFDTEPNPGNPYDGNPEAPAPRESCIRRVPEMMQFEDVISQIMDHGAKNIAESVRQELKAVNDKALVLASRLVKMEKACDTNRITELMGSISQQAIKHYFVKDFGFINGDIVIVTDRLVARAEGDRFDLGQIEIRFSAKEFMSGIISEPIFFNLTHDVSDMDGQAGHVDHSGVPCLGGWLIPLAQYAEDYNITGVIDQFIGFLTEPDSEDGMGCYILSFPRL